MGNDRNMDGSRMGQLYSKCTSFVKIMISVQGVDYTSKSRIANTHKADDRTLACIQAPCIKRFRLLDSSSIDSKHVDWIPLSKLSQDFDNGQPMLLTRLNTDPMGICRMCTGICLKHNNYGAHSTTMAQLRTNVTNPLLHLYVIM